MLPTELTEKLPPSKSSLLKRFSCVRTTRSFRSALIYLIDFMLTFFSTGVVKPLLESMAIAKLCAFRTVYD